MGMSWHCEHEKRMDRIGTGIIQCALDGQICLNQQYCPSKRRYEITASYAKCGKRPHPALRATFPKGEGKNGE